MKKRIIIILSLINLVTFGWGYFGNKEETNDLAVYIDDNLENSIPRKGEATYLKSVCDQGVNVTWDNDLWGLKINNLTRKVNCKLYFSSDTEKPQWQISKVSKTSGFTTDDYTVELTGTDNFGLTSNLTVDDIKLSANDSSCWALKKSVEEVSSNDKQVKYQLNLSMPSCVGSLSLSINQNTLTDTSGNNSEKVSLNTGITINKNNTKKILVWYDYNSEAYDDISAYYSNVTQNTNLTTSEIIAAKYDLVVYYRPYWQLIEGLNTLYNAGINLLTQGNDPNSDSLMADASVPSVSPSDCSSATIKKVVNNNLTSYYQDEFIERDSPISFWKFNQQATILYQAEYNGITYDKIGYLKENNHMWFNNATDYLLPFSPIIEFIFGNLKE